MQIPSSGSMRRVLVSPPEGDGWARRGSHLRRVFDLLADGGWHTGSEIHHAYNQGNPDPESWGWEWQSCIAQLRDKFRDPHRPQGGSIESQSIGGRDEYRYRMTLPKQRILQPHLERTAAQIEDLRASPATMRPPARAKARVGASCERHHPGTLF